MGTRTHDLLTACPPPVISTYMYYQCCFLTGGLGGILLLNVCLYIIIQWRTFPPKYEYLCHKKGIVRIW